MKGLLLNKIPLSLYVHLPWCETQCPYCDFSITTEPVDGNDARLAEAIVKDIKHSSDFIAGRKFKSVYFGGGTPSLASTQSIKQILDSVRDRLESSETEITLEMNPNDVSEKKVEGLLGVGINRISLGIQSYSDQELQALGRNHDRKSAIQATKKLKDINSTIDLIYGIEKQTPESFTENLETIINSNVNHLSLYQLTIEPNTIFYKKELVLPGEEAIEKMEAIAKDLLETNGFQQYEVSSWSKPGHESQHNLNYWQFGDFLGVGPGSHSKISNKQEMIRYRKIKPLEGYIQNQKSADLKTIAGNELDMDLAMNLLRIKDGLQHQDLAIDLPESFLKKYQRGVDEGLLLKDKIGATQKGYQFLNETIQLFF
ncbi:radical SAM family heme chaperone HemW [Gammaproteobacteria bacterium]|nr:radical SAM family heme chaperone HemW [Gammaproteobacteria bacterium]MDA9799896.1 radical SAM family heme chaperone HemW [Gammaproteobacteria bacterium]